MLSGEIRKESIASMARSISLQIGNMKQLDVQGAASINKAINDSHFPEAERAMLARATQNKCLERTQQGMLRRGTQTMLNVCEYFTDDDWKVFQNDSSSAHQKIMRMSDRLLLLGLTNPSESTVKHLVAVLACTHAGDTSADALLAFVHELKNALAMRRATKKVPNLEHMPMYPESPQDLPRELYNHGYSDGAEPPVSVVLSNFNSILGQIPLRKTHGGLSTAASRLGVATQSGTQQPAINNVVQVLLQQLLGANSTGAQLQNLVIHKEQRGRGDGRIDSPRTPIADGHGNSLVQQLMGSVVTPQLQAVTDHSGHGSPGQNAQRLALQLHTPRNPVPEPETLAQALPGPGPQAAEATAEDGDTAMGAEKEMAASEADDEIDKLVTRAAKIADDTLKPAGKGKCKTEAKAQGKVDPKCKASAKGKAKSKVAPVCKAGPKAKAKSKGQAKAKGKTQAAKKTLLLGCGKCRGSHTGCVQCRNPSYNGRRWQA